MMINCEALFDILTKVFADALSATDAVESDASGDASSSVPKDELDSFLHKPSPLV